MSWTKRELITAAFETIGISTYNFDISPEMYNIGLRRLDAMMGSWNSSGIRLAYPIPSQPANSNIDDVTNIPDYANEAVFINLAVILAPIFGKQLEAGVKQSALQAYNAMLAKNMDIPERQVNQTVPAGAGNKWRRFYSPYLVRPEDNPSDTDGPIENN